MEFLVFFLFQRVPQEHTGGTITAKLNVSGPAVSEYLRECSAKGQRDVSRGKTAEKRDGRSKRMEEDDPRNEGMAQS